MKQEITPEAVIDRVTRAHMPLSSFLRSAKIGTSSFYRWKNGESGISRITAQKIADGLAEIEELKGRAA